MIVLDTNVVSELMRSTPNPVVEAWVHARHSEGLYTTAITVAEIGYGIERLPDGVRKTLLTTTAHLKDFDRTGIDVIDPWQPEV